MIYPQAVYNSGEKNVLQKKVAVFRVFCSKNTCFLWITLCILCINLLKVQNRKPFIWYDSSSGQNSVHIALIYGKI
jgi:hypothetical protein